MFEPEGFWRDLVSFTWNIKTCEGRGEIKAMLAARLADVKPRNFQAKTAEWFSFETALGRGIGHLRLRDKHCWTLLTTLQELKGHSCGNGRKSRCGTQKTGRCERNGHTLRFIVSSFLRVPGETALTVTSGLR